MILYERQARPDIPPAYVLLFYVIIVFVLVILSDYLTKGKK